MQMDRIEGEVSSVQSDGTFRLRFDFNVMADFEAQTGRNALAALSTENLSALSAGDIRLMIHLCLRDHHPDLTERDAGRIYSRDVGVFARLMAATFPDVPSTAEDAPGNAIPAA